MGTALRPPAACISLSGDAGAVAPQSRGPCPHVTAGATAESLLDGDKDFIFTGASVANSFIFTPVTPSKLAECVQELAPPVMRRTSHGMCH